MIMRKVDAVTLEIAGNVLLSIAEEMGLALIRSAYSTNIKERRDISTAVFDPKGNMVAQAEHVPMHLGSLLGIIKVIIKRYGTAILPGDMFMANDPYGGGGTHLPDITIAAPVFKEKVLIGWVANLAHHSDVGGKVPGSTSGDANSIFQEGLKIPVVRVTKAGKTCKDMLHFVMANSRLPDERYGDLQAQLAANRIGVRRLHEAYERYGNVLIDSMYELQDYAERRLRAGIQDLPDGNYSFTDYMDDGGVAYPNPIKITLSLNIKGDSILFDFSDTHPQVGGPINVTYNGLLATVFYALKAFVDPGIPSNAGIYRVINVKAEAGSIINCKNPAPVGARIDTCMRVADVIFGAFAQVAPERAIAGCNSSCTTAIFSGTDPDDPSKFYVYLETIAGGSGASMAHDGLSGVQVHMTNTSNLPVEALEMEFPYLEVLEYALVRDSGGAGKTRGGLGILRRFEVKYENILYTGLGDRQVFPPWGLNGGYSGSGGRYEIRRSDGNVEHLSSKVTDIVLNRGDIVSVYTPGGGGYGAPGDRDKEDVLADFVEGYISEQSARKLYGVNLTTEQKST